MLTDNIYEVFAETNIDPNLTFTNQFILLPHQVIPKYYLISDDNVNKLILNYSLGSGKTAPAVFIILYYLNLYRKYQFINRFALINSSYMQRNEVDRNVIVVGAWQTIANRS